MIDRISAAPNVAYTAKLMQKYQGNADQQTQATDLLDKVTISDEGQRMNKAVSQAVMKGDSTFNDLSALPVWAGNYEEARQRAQAGLSAALQQFGISSDTKVGISFNSDGTLSVSSNSPKNAELEAFVNNNRELRNALVAADNTAHLSRLCAEQQQVIDATKANPGKADTYNTWLIGVSQQIMKMPWSFEFVNGSLSGSFEVDGKKVGLYDQLISLPT